MTAIMQDGLNDGIPAFLPSCKKEIQPSSKTAI
jgi:hypothetical protein